MGSGFSGQSFAFNGYLNRERGERIAKIRKLEERAIKEGQTQIFMETPYRNEALFEDMLSTLLPTTRVSVGLDLSLPKQYIKTRSVSEWNKNQRPNLNKRPCIFSLFV